MNELAKELEIQAKQSGKKNTKQHIRLKQYISKKASCHFQSKFLHYFSLNFWVQCYLKSDKERPVLHSRLLLKESASSKFLYAAILS